MAQLNIENYRLVGGFVGPGRNCVLFMPEIYASLDGFVAHVLREGHDRVGEFNNQFGYIFVETEKK